MTHTDNTKLITELKILKSEKEFSLEGGNTLPELEVAYETYGQLNENKDNAVLVIHALTMSAHAAGCYENDPQNSGWWDDLIGPGKPLDTDRFFIVCSNNLGSCYGTSGPKSINPTINKPYAMDFPIITIFDMVNAQKVLMEHLGVPFWHTVIGGSQGGMEVLEWAIAYPELVKNAVPIATTHRLSAQNLAFDAVARTAIMEDNNWNEGNYYDSNLPASGLSVARMIAHITYLSEQSMHERFGRQLRHTDKYNWDFSPEFAVETYLEYKGDSFVKRFDANSYLYLTKAMAYFDLGEKYGSLFNAMQRTKARFLILSFNSDWLFPTAQSKEMVSELRKSGKDVSFLEIDTKYGHDAFLLEATGPMTDILRGFFK